MTKRRTVRLKEGRKLRERGHASPYAKYNKRPFDYTSLFNRFPMLGKAPTGNYQKETM